MGNKRYSKLVVCVTLVLFIGIIFMPMISSQQIKKNALEEYLKEAQNDPPLLIKNITYNASYNYPEGWSILFTVEIVDNATVDCVEFDLEPFGQRPGLPFSDYDAPYQWLFVTRSRPMGLMRVTAFGPTGIDIKEFDL